MLALPEDDLQDRRASGVRLKPIPFLVYFVHPYRDRWADIFEATELRVS